MAMEKLFCDIIKAEKRSRVLRRGHDLGIRRPAHGLEHPHDQSNHYCYHIKMINGVYEISGYTNANPYHYRQH
jgi:hypothetical protein